MDRSAQILTPSQLNILARDLLEGAFPLIWVEAELGKQLASGLLPALRGEAEASDPVTKVLLAELKSRS